MQAARAGPRHRPVDGVQQRSGLVAAHRALDLQAGARRRVDAQIGRRSRPARRGQGRGPARLGQAHIVQQRPRRRQFGPGEIAERLQRRDREMILQPPLPGGGGEIGVRQWRQGRPAQIAHRHFHPARLAGALRCDDLARPQRGQFGRQRAGLQRRGAELPRGDIGPGHRHFARAQPRDAGEIIGAARVQQRILGQRAGRDDPHDLPPHHGLRAALLRLLRVLGLLAHRHAETLADEAGEIGLRRRRGHAAHRNVLAQMLAALGQRDVQRFGGFHRVLEEQLVEVAHPVEQQCLPGLFLHVQELGHHRRHALTGRRGLGGAVCVHEREPKTPRASRKSGLLVALSGPH